MFQTYIRQNSVRAPLYPITLPQQQEIHGQFCPISPHIMAEANHRHTSAINISYVSKKDMDSPKNNFNTNIT